MVHTHTLFHMKMLPQSVPLDIFDYLHLIACASKSTSCFPLLQKYFFSIMDPSLP